MGDFEIKNSVLVKYTENYKGNYKKIIIPDSVTSIKPGVFCNLWHVQEIVFPNHDVMVEGFGNFNGCKELSQLTLTKNTLHDQVLNMFGLSGKTLKVTYISKKEPPRKAVISIMGDGYDKPLSPLDPLELPLYDEVVANGCGGGGYRMNEEGRVQAMLWRLADEEYPVSEENKKAFVPLLDKKFSSVVAIAEEEKKPSYIDKVLTLGIVNGGNVNRLKRVLKRSTNKAIKALAECIDVKPTEEVEEKKVINNAGLGDFEGQAFIKDVSKFAYVSVKLRLLQMQEDLYETLKVGDYLEPNTILKVAKLSDLKPAKLKKQVREIKVVEIKKYPASKKAYPKIFVDALLELKKQELYFDIVPSTGDDLGINNNIYIADSNSLWDIRGISPLCVGIIDAPVRFKVSKGDYVSFGGAEKIVEYIQEGFYYDANPKCTATCAEMLAVFQDVKISAVSCSETEKGYEITAKMCAEFELTIEKENIYGESVGCEPKNCISKIEYITEKSKAAVLKASHCSVKVRFADGQALIYNCEKEVSVGNQVMVSGAQAGMKGTVEEIVGKWSKAEDAARVLIVFK